MENFNASPSAETSVEINQEQYQSLSDEQKAYFDEQLEYYVRTNNTVMARKFAKRTMRYVAEAQVTKDGATHIVHGEHGDHTVQDGACTCDLYNGRGNYEGRGQQDCSHVQAVLVYSLGAS